MILALDYGTRYIGVAITDPDERLALRYEVIDQKKVDALKRLTAIVEMEKVGKVLVGVPISLSGNVSQQTKINRNFIEHLRKALNPHSNTRCWNEADTAQDVVIEEVDETLTSVEAERRVAAEGGKKEDAHMEAARMMLEEYLQKTV